MIDKSDKQFLDRIAMYERIEGSEDMEFNVKMTDPTQEDMIMIFNLYKKYVDTNIQEFKTGCNCQNSITNIFFGLANWYKANFFDFI